MTIARFYVMEAGDGRDAALEAALTTLADKIRVLPGSAGIDLLHDGNNASRFIFIEKWVSSQAHQNAKGSVDKETLGAVSAACGKPPESFDGAYFDYLKTI
jgi:quinol monooxygenase YgiN